MGCLLSCFAHIVNLSVQAFLDALPGCAKHFQLSKHPHLTPKDTERYLKALESKPVDCCRALVSACCASSSRREGIRHTVVEGNASGLFKTPQGQILKVPEVELSQDCPTRWSSAYIMMDRYIDLYPVSVADI